MRNRPQLDSFIEELRKPGALARRLDATLKDIKTIYIMGCARSGTWLLTGIMSTFEDVSVLNKEVPVEYFGLHQSYRRALVLKRDAQAHETIETIPPQIMIIFIVRHPFDVLTSVHPHARRNRGRLYYVTPGRWLGETMALKWLMESGRPQTKIVRYEDLVGEPNKIQSEIAAFAELQLGTPATEFHTTFKPSSKIVETMHGLRSPELTSVERWRTDPNAGAYLRTLELRLGESLSWVGRTFGYDTQLDCI
jgi:hypothetical protein